jgi:membrane protease YdiL (CAAX protease family)
MKIWLEIFVLTVAPIAPIYFRIFPNKWRYYMFAVLVAISCFIMYEEGWSLEKAGINLNHPLMGLAAYIVFTILAAAALLAASRIWHRKPSTKWRRDPHFLFGFVLMSLGQEILYRSYLMPRLEEVIGNIVLVIIVNALLFTLVHIIFPDKKINLPLSFAGGLCLASLYAIYPNLLLIFISHSILNFLGTLFGFFSYKDM